MKEWLCFSSTDMVTGPGRLTNISVRSFAGTGAQNLIAGFIIAGTGRKEVLMRGVGPTLKDFGVKGELADPSLRVVTPDAKFEYGSNDNWGGAAELATAFRSVEAFDLPADSSDAAMIATLQPGLYTVILSGVGDSKGVALVEVYALP